MKILILDEEFEVFETEDDGFDKDRKITTTFYDQYGYDEDYNEDQDEENEA